MKLVVAGSRSIKDIKVVFNEIDKYAANNKIDMIVTGGAKGVDHVAWLWAERMIRLHRLRFF